MHRNPSRPMSPHLTIWKWGPHMAVSILHRATGLLLSFGLLLLAGWLLALALGPSAYAQFSAFAASSSAHAPSPRRRATSASHR